MIVLSFYIRLKTEFSRMISYIYICTYDITSMYTNMYCDELIKAVETIHSEMRENDYAIPLINKESLVQITDLVLNNNEFEFAQSYFKQRIGCAMGAVPSPEICDIRAYEVLNSILQKFPYRDNILMHRKFRDDGFILYNGPIEHLKILFDIANKEHNLLKFTYEISETSVNFLDITIFKGTSFKETNVLDTKSYITETETFQYLHRKSVHPEGTFKGFIKGETLRHIRLNSSNNNLSLYINNFKSKLLDREYATSEIEKCVNSALKTDRTNALLSKTKCHNKGTPLTMVTQYHPTLRKLSSLLRKHWSYILNDPEAYNLFKRPPIVAFKRGKNVSDIITSTVVKLD